LKRAGAGYKFGWLAAAIALLPCYPFLTVLPLEVCYLPPILVAGSLIAAASSKFGTHLQANVLSRKPDNWFTRAIAW